MHINLEDEYALTGISGSGFPDEVDNGAGCREGQLPFLSSVPMGVDVRINPPLQLRTIDNCAADDGSFLVDRVERATKDLEGEFGLDEGADEGTEAGFLVDIDLDVLFKERSPLEVELCILGFWFGRERNVPSKA